MESMRRRVWLVTVGTAACLSLSPLTNADVATTAATTAKPVATHTQTALAAAVSPVVVPRGKADIRSGAALVIDEDSSLVLLSKRADVPAPIASITKLMTALVVFDAAQALDEPIEITRDDRNIEKGGRSRLTVGARLTRGELLRLALMSSENRAAHAVGRSYPGGTDALLDAMNAKARALGMKNAHFADATGLSSENVASPRDLSKLVMAASRNVMIREFSTDPRESVLIGRNVLEFRNTNNLVANDDWDVIVQKTGFTNDAGQCLVMKTVIRDRPVVIVLLNSYGKHTRVADARRVRQWMERSTPAQQVARTTSASS
jgi:D-alanyl-D-alanine endopeptidase (penicillin-binding protein 7)